jgi:hypothetical protein
LPRAHFATVVSSKNSGIFYFQLNVFSYFSGFNFVIFELFGNRNMREQRKNFRVEWNSPAKIYDRHGRFAGQCIVSNFSNGGAKITGLDPHTVPDAFILRISPHSRAQECRVVRRSKDELGVEFTGEVKGTSEPALGRRRKSRRQTPAMA